MDAQDLALEAIYQAALYADYRQTRRIAERPDKFFEQSPFMDRNPTTNQVRNYFVLSAITHYTITELLPQGPYRRAWQSLTISYQFSYVEHNIRIGIRF